MKKLSATLLGAALGLAALQSQAAPFVGGRTDFRDETIYFAMTTRFYDGDHSNNTYCWDGVNNVNDPEWRGDFKGLIEKLDYIKAMGFTAIWITPVVENASGLDYHGYHAINFSKVDPRYESTDCKFEDLINAAHNKGIKIILDIVLQHTGNFGEENLCPLFAKDYTQPQSNINKILTLHPNTLLPSNYFSLPAGQQYQARLARMKNTDGQNHDTHNYWHHYGSGWNWDEANRWWGQIAGDCVDLNTENPATINYLVNCYGSFIALGVDGFRIDTSGHISRLAFNKGFIPKFQALGEQYKSKRLNEAPFFMFGEVCARFSEATYRGQDCLSPYFYTWKEDKDYAWDDSETSWDNYVVMEGYLGDHVNIKSAAQQGDDYASTGHYSSSSSNNAFLQGNAYHTPDYSKYSGLSIIDFPMHWNFGSASQAFGVKRWDGYYNDATWNVVYVDSHDYGPDSFDRYNGGTEAWAENMSLMFTFRGIPCLYYGSEIEFRKGVRIDEGANLALFNSGRAYYGGYITGDVEASDFGVVKSASGNVAATLSQPLPIHLARLNQIRASVPALRKGQYSTEGCSGNMAFKRRYTDANTDSYCLVTISGNATFTGIENGTYTDCVTGDVKTVTDGTLTASCSGRGNLRVYVLSTSKTPAPGKIGTDTQFLYGTSPVTTAAKGYDGQEEAMDTETVRDTGGEPGGGGSGREEPETPIAPSLEAGEQAVFFIHESWTAPTVWIWNGSNNFTGGSWPGQQMTYLGNNYYKWTYTGSDEVSGYLIFSNSGNNQTWDGETVAFVNGGVYNASGYVEKIEASGVGVTLSPNGGTFENTLTVNITATGATSAWYKIGSGSQVSFTGSTSFTIGGNMSIGESVTVSWSATDGSVTKTGSAVFTKVEKKSTVWTVFFDNSNSNWSNVNAYVYHSSGDKNKGHEITGGWPGKAMTLDGAYYTISMESEADLSDCCIIFNNGSGSQTGDNVKIVNRGIYNVNGFTGESGVNNLNVDSNNAPVEYYNLQGVRIDEPTTNGVYIRRQGNKVNKIIVR